MAKTYRISVLTHVRKDYTFNKPELLSKFICDLDIKECFKKQLINDSYVHVPSNKRANSLDVYIINEYNEYYEEYSDSLTRSKNNIDVTNEKLKLLSKYIDDKNEMVKILKESHKQDLFINDMKNKSVMLNFAIALTKVGGNDLFKMVEKEFYQRSNNEVLNTYEQLFK